MLNEMFGWIGWCAGACALFSATRRFFGMHFYSKLYHSVLNIEHCAVRHFYQQHTRALIVTSDRCVCLSNDAQHISLVYLQKNAPTQL